MKQKMTIPVLAVVLCAGTVQADGNFLSLPKVNDSAFGYGKSVDGAVSDKLFYTLGGGSVISQPATRSNMQKLGVDLGWSSDLMCGNFDLKTTVGNQLNGITDGFKNLMGDVIQGASGAVASLPAMVIQRANPGLYDMLTNGVLQANMAFDKAQLNCQNMAKRMMEFTDSNKWTQAAMLEEYKKIVNTGDGDAIKGDEAGRQVTGEEGQRWIGGQQRGGAGQSAIRPTHDLTAAGFNMMNSLPSTSTSSVSPGNCNGSACMKYRNAEEAARAVVKVLGDKSMRTCGDAKACTSGDADQQPGISIAGTGFAPMLEEATRVNTELLAGMVNGRDKPTAGNLAKLKAGSLSVTAGVIRALQRDPDNGALTLRLAGELAMADTVETALLMRRMLLTGMAEPYAAAQPAALEEGERRIEALDREIMALKNEMELKRDLARNSVLTIIERDNERVGNNPMIQQADNADSRIHSLDAPDKE
ncbi:TPA: integrating conjugative element protein [Escherichia coli]|uniref:integrating conjugative element protein n=1 Tax=Escherichia coli TaxID=562 RepID=UPI000BE96155|nr:integrating conjugative element protein [Escherichia coli]EFO1808203.1 integrating conjugative element protein [Escherichia coli]EGK4048924.1 integrating conjugative element protein [Escherichia coli]EGK4058331.1 integrating conjugative element protein [Escherichia coli]MCJ2713634.1 integrating conjugative element protein [Escherichia coli]PSY70190.1 integrating conjugative element protein [Escherichia coli]